jgi:hypothetical protein
MEALLATAKRRRAPFELLDSPRQCLASTRAKADEPPKLNALHVAWLKVGRMGPSLLLYYRRMRDLCARRDRSLHAAIPQG